MNLDHLAIWSIAALATGCIIVRPFHWREATFAALGAGLLVAAGLLDWREALLAIQRGTDVYLFLVGMMLLAEVARLAKLFDWLASHAVRSANGSGWRLFSLVYGVGTLVTVFLSNDATAVVLTPAVAAAARAAGASPLPYLFICAFIANAASFVLPISNPANLVLFGDQMPPLGTWLRTFGWPSVAAILATYIALRFAMRSQVPDKITMISTPDPLSREGKVAGWGIAATAIALVATSAANLDLGLPTLGCGLLVLVVAALAKGRHGLPLLSDSLRGIAWDVLPLVAGLFVLVAGLEKTGITRSLAALMQAHAQSNPMRLAWLAGLVTGLGSNLINNLPMGLFAAATAANAQASSVTKGALLIGVDLGPNLSVTGSLATLLWLIAIRRDGTNVSGWDFLKIGLMVTPPALLLALLALLGYFPGPGS